jgi:hypothetical protein
MSNASMRSFSKPSRKTLGQDTSSSMGAIAPCSY